MEIVDTGLQGLTHIHKAHELIGSEYLIGYIYFFFKKNIIGKLALKGIIRLGRPNFDEHAATI